MGEGREGWVEGVDYHLFALEEAVCEEFTGAYCRCCLFERE